MTTQNRRDRAGGRDRLTPQGQQTGPQLATSPDPGADPAAPAPPLQWPRSSARENAEDDANDPRTVRPTELGLTTCNPSSAKSQTAGTAQRSSHPATTPNRKTLPASTQRHTPATASGSLLERKTSAYKKCHLCVRTTVTHVSGLYTKPALPPWFLCGEVCWSFQRKCPDRTLDRRKSLSSKGYGRTHFGLLRTDRTWDRVRVPNLVSRPVRVRTCPDLCVRTSVSGPDL